MKSSARSARFGICAAIALALSVGSADVLAMTWAGKDQVGFTNCSGAVPIAGYFTAWYTGGPGGNICYRNWTTSTWDSNWGNDTFVSGATLTGSARGYSLTSSPSYRLYTGLKCTGSYVVVPIGTTVYGPGKQSVSTAAYASTCQAA